MNKSQFLFELERGLYGISETSRRRIINHYDRVITKKMQNGMSEEAAVASIGDVNNIIHRALGLKSVADSDRFKGSVEQIFNIFNGTGARNKRNILIPKLVQFFVAFMVMNVILSIITSVLGNLTIDSLPSGTMQVVAGIISVALNAGFIGFVIVIIGKTIMNPAHSTNEMNCNQHLTHQGLRSGMNSDIKHGQSSFECNDHLSHEKKSYSFFGGRNDIDSMFESTPKDTGVRDFEQQFLGSSSSNYGFSNTSQSTSQYSDSVSDDPSFQFSGNNNAFQGVANVTSVVSTVFKVVLTIIGIVGIVIGGLGIALLVNLSMNNINFPGLYIVCCAQIMFSSAFLTAGGKGKHKIAKIIGKVVLSIILTVAGVVTFGIQLSEMEPVAISVEEFMEGYEGYDTKIISYDFSIEHGLRLPSVYTSYEFTIDENLPDGRIELLVPAFMEVYPADYDYSEYYTTELDFEVRLQEDIDMVKHFIKLQLDGIKTMKYIMWMNIRIQVI